MNLVLKKLVSTPFEPALPPHSEAFLAEINAQLKQQLNAATKELEYARLKIQLWKSICVYGGSKSAGRAVRS